MTDEEYVPGTLSGRPIYWCPSGNGYPAYCPRPTDSDEYTYCCVYGYGIDMPTCCRFPFHTGLLYTMIFSLIIIIAG
ncbi:unnamed protein product [Thelazia callipaeda]|uniref:Uncharacterized protein n=1 Tax=Thelazia callipaeda TaxID=103827 RepID=A0A0N5CL54_THECL|nr:unnamed protein product [Thelazia callipaeda]